MSRFYEALKQASQYLHRSRDGVGPGESQQPGTAGPSDFSAILNQMEEQYPPAPREEGAGIESQAIAAASASAEAHSSVLAQDGSLGILTEAALDKRARLIPNAVEPMVLEYYRAIRTKMMQRRKEKPFRSLLVTSTNPKEGKTVIALNLAWTFSMLPAFKVLVVDGDLRNGQLSKWLGIADRPGLANLLEGSTKLNEVVLKSTKIPFYFISHGSSELSPPELLHTARWRIHCQKIAEYFDLVIVDSPPVNLVTDAQLLAYGCDALVLVARAFHTSQGALERLTSHEVRPFRVVGTILNACPANGRGRYNSYYHYGREETGKEAGRNSGKEEPPASSE